MPASSSGRQLLSIVIPCYNAEKTIGRTLESVFSSSFKNFEVIVADDASTDGTIEAVKKFRARIVQAKKNMGPAFARNQGARLAKGEIIVFIDADVLVEKNTLEKISARLEGKKIPVLQAIYSKDCPMKNFASQYQNLYQHYNFFSIKSGTIQTVNTYCVALRKKDFIEFNVAQRTSEDSEWGYKLSSQNREIFLDKGIQVKHLQEFSLGKILKRSYQMSRNKIRSMRRFRQQRKVDWNKTNHGRKKLLAIIFSPIPPLFWLFSLGFFSFVFREKGFFFLLKTILFHEINCFACLLGVIRGQLLD